MLPKLPLTPPPSSCPPPHCLPLPNTVVKAGEGSRPTCQWLQLDQGTARAHGHHVEVAEGPLDTFLEVLSGWGLHWNYLWCQPPRMNKLPTHLAAMQTLSAPNRWSQSISSGHLPVLGDRRASHPKSIPSTPL